MTITKAYYNYIQPFPDYEVHVLQESVLGLFDPHVKHVREMFATMGARGVRKNFLYIDGRSSKGQWRSLSSVAKLIAQSGYRPASVISP